MTKQKLFTLFATLAITIFAMPALAADTVKIAQNGKALAAIQISPSASVATRSVAREMQQYLHRISGGQFAIDHKNGNGARIVLGRNNEFPQYKMGPRLRGQGQETFLMHTEGKKVLLLGVTDTAVGHAAYAFLQKLGVRWFFPTKTWTVVPHKPTISVSLNEVESPDMSMQRAMWYGGMNSGYPAVTLLTDWERHNLMKPSGPVTSHSWIGLNPRKDFKTHPDWFALVKGKRRPTKPNYGNPEVVKIAIKHALKAAANGAKSITVSAPDGLGFSTGDDSLKVAGVPRSSLHKIKGAIFGTRPDGTQVCVTSETIFRMANAVAAALKKNYPHVLVGVYAYSGYAQPPSFKLEPNIYVVVTSRYRRTPLTYEQQIRQLGQKSRQMGVYEYYHEPVFDGFNPAKGPKMHFLQSRMKFYHANHIVGIDAEGSDNWGAAGLDFYAASKLMWNVNTNIDALYADFLDKAFGPAKAPMKTYYDRYENKVTMNKATIAAALGDLITAYGMAKTKAVKKRIAQLYLFNRFFKYRMEYRATAKAPDQDPAIGKEYANLFWRLKDEFLIHERVTSGVNRPLAPAFTAKEIATKMAQDQAWIDKNKVLFLTYSRNLVPITTAKKAIPGVENKPLKSGKFRKLQLTVPAKTGQTIDLEVQTTYKTSPYRVTYLTADQFHAKMNNSLATEVSKGDTAGKVSFTAKKTGFYHILIRNIARVKSINSPHLLQGHWLDMYSGTMYFYVPKGTSKFTVSANGYKGPTVTVRNASGKVMFEHKGFTVLRKDTGQPTHMEHTITVPKGQGGAVWSVTGPGSLNTKSAVYLEGVPPYFAFTPKQLMVAREYLQKGQK